MTLSENEKEYFITDIIVRNSRNLQDLNIPISKNKRQHLILTGKNGSGKTSLLLEINKFLNMMDNGEFYKHYSYWVLERQKILNSQTSNNYSNEVTGNIDQLNNIIQQFGGTEILFSSNYSDVWYKRSTGKFLLAFFDSKRHVELEVPQGIKKVELQKKYQTNQKANSQFIQYIVNLKADRSFAKDDDEMEVVHNIDNWFERFEKRLQTIFGSPSLKLKFNRKSYNFDIEIEGQELFNFNTLSDGYSAILSIVTELLLRMEAHDVKSYDLEGIVVIDEIETHLHVELQKKILPFLIDFFPKLQFIVSTHSPFVLSSLSNATICDLETKAVTTDLSSYSYDALLESYFAV